MLMQVAGGIATDCDQTRHSTYIHPFEITGYHSGDYAAYCLLDVTPCSLVNRKQYFGKTCRIHLQGIRIFSRPGPLYQ